MPRGKLPHIELIIRTPTGVKIGVVAPYTKKALVSLRKAVAWTIKKDPPLAVAAPSDREET
jgi:hypothetical protein